jgi:hypothetical protein
MIRSVNVIKALPAFQEQCSWLPVDLCARTVIELSGIFGSNMETSGRLMESPVFYNVLNPRTFDWTLQLLPLLQAADINFEIVTPRDWLGLIK